MFNSNADFRELMESIGEIEEAHDGDFGHEEHGDTCEHHDAKDMLKCIISSLKDVAQRVANGDIDDSSTLEGDLQRIHDSLMEIIGEEKHSEDEHVEHDEDHEKVEEDKGADVTLAMAPKINSKGVQDYSNPCGDSYAARMGFTGI